MILQKYGTIFYMNNNEHESIDFLAVGDCVVDAFIELQDAKVHCDINTDECRISMRFGDKIPYKKVDMVYAVGNSPNASVSAHRLGLSSAVLTHIGNDDNGMRCMTQLADEGIDTRYIITENGKDTNYHFVLRYDAERTILINHTDFTYDFEKEMQGLPKPKWIYVSSVAETAEQYHDQIAEYLEKNRDIKMAFQPGTFQIKLGKNRLKKLYELSEVFFCNKEEAQRILESAERDMVELCKGISALGPKITVLTDGPNGAWAYDGKNAWHIPMYPDPKPPVDRTGAGDSFSSTFTVALAQGKTIQQALEYGPVNSMNVVQYIGAQKGLLTPDAIEQYLINRPAHYQVTQVL